MPTLLISLLCAVILTPVDIQNSWGDSTLHWAAQNGYNNVVKTLCGKMANVNIQNDRGITALQGASREDRIDVVTILCANQADVNIQNSENGGTALHMAAKFGNYEIVAILLANNANQSIENYEGDTPMTLAQWKGKYEVVKILEAVSELSKDYYKYKI